MTDWQVQPISIADFSGHIKTKETVLDNGSLFTHIVYIISYNGEVMAGIGNDLEKVAIQIQERVQEYYDKNTETSGVHPESE